MAIHDQNFQTTAGYQNSGKYPRIFFSDTEWYNQIGYVNNSLEGTIFDSVNQNIILDGQQFSPKFKFFDVPTVSSATITGAAIVSNVCTVTCSGGHSFLAGDVVSVVGVAWDNTHPYINGTWIVSANICDQTVLRDPPPVSRTE